MLSCSRAQQLIVNPTGTANPIPSDYMSSKELLCALWPGDYGEDSPNPDTATLLNKFGLPSKSKLVNSYQPKT